MSFHEGRLLEQAIAVIGQQNPDLVVLSQSLRLPVTPAALEAIAHNRSGTLTGLSFDADARTRLSYTPDLVVVNQRYANATILDVKRSVASYLDTHRLAELKTKMLATSLILPDWLYKEQKRLAVDTVGIAIVDGASAPSDHANGIWALAEIDDLLEIEGAAEAICEAVMRPTMRFVAIKSKEQQAALSLHRTRNLLVKQRTQLVNMTRALLAEFGIDIPEGLERALGPARRIATKETAPDVPATALQILDLLCGQVLDTHARLQTIDRSILALQRRNDIARRLSTIPGIGPVGATAFAASVANPAQFHSGREFAAWLGLTPSQNSSGGKDRLGCITKMGDRYLRKLLVVGVTSLIRRARYKSETADLCLVALLARKPARVASVAMANKMARIVWAITPRGVIYQARHAPMLAGGRSESTRGRQQSVRADRLQEVVRATRCNGTTGQAGDKDNPLPVRGVIAS